MNFAPHILERLERGTTERDSNGDAIVVPDKWETIGKCRCDDATTEVLRGQDGNTYSPVFKIVTTRDITLKQGEEVRALYQDGQIRGRGIVDKPVTCNYLQYHTFYLK